MIRQLDVDGVPAVLAPVTGPMHAGLVFRVGVADEPLAKRGITHLVEHLALPGDEAGTHRNSTTGIEHTYFHVRGTAERIAEFLTGVCAALRRVPTGRIAAEREILRAEATARPGEPLPMWRHGARDFGVPSYPEWGLGGLTDAHLQEWIAQYFTRENAALWIAGDRVPAGLCLDLPEGARQAAPAPSSALPVTPAYFTGPDDRTAWDTVVPRQARAAVFANVLERRLLRELSAGDAIAETVRTDYTPRGGRAARITATVEPLPGKRGEALSGLIGALDAMRDGRVEADDVASVVELTCDGLREAEKRGGRLPGQAFNVLAGLSVRGLDEAVAEVRAVTPGEVAEVAADAYGAGLLMTPAGSGADQAGYTAAPYASEAAVPGRTHRARGNRGLRLVHGEEGVSMLDGDAIATVRYDACAALLIWPDGGRQLIGDDAVVVRVEPTLYRDGEAVAGDLDARVPATARIEMPDREPEKIPRPPSGAWQSWLDLWGRA